MEILAIIPARGGSKRVKDKNIKLLAGKPLIAYSIDQAKKSKLVTRVVVSTDSLAIKEISMQYGAEVIDRPAEFAVDTAPTLPVLWHVLHHLHETENYVPKYIVLLQPTNPLRTTEDIDACIQLMLKHSSDTVVSVREAQETPFWMFTIEKGVLQKVVENTTARSQDLPKAYLLNGAVYVLDPSIVLNQKTTLGVLGDTNIPYVMPLERSQDIDIEEDFEEVEKMMVLPINLE